MAIDRNEKSVSSVHCRISLRDNNIFVSDLKTKNGTFINENRVLTETMLISGNVLRLGAVRFMVHIN